jgi:hypothetical protein
MKIGKETVFRGFPRRFLRSLGSSGWRSVALDELARRVLDRLPQLCPPERTPESISQSWCLAQAHTPRNHRLINALAEMLAHLGNNLLD